MYGRVAKVIAASGGGKIKTISQMIAIIVLLFGANYNNTLLLQVGTIFMIIATFFTLYSGADYLYKNKDLFMNSK